MVKQKKGFYLFGRYSAMRYVEDEFFYAYALYSETVLKLDFKMDQKRKQKENSEKETRKLSHLDEKSLFMNFKVVDESSKDRRGNGLKTKFPLDA
ncbi:hypothetical protein Tco_0542558 [Tanacetum coccineum]